MNCEFIELEPLECEAYQTKEVLKILLHSIVFQRALGELKLRDQDSDLFDISYVRCDSRAVAQRVDEYAESFSSELETLGNRTAEQYAKSRAQAQAQAGVVATSSAAAASSSADTNSPPPRVPAKICVAFFERRSRPGAFGLFRGEEKVVWERWNIVLSVRTPEAPPEPSTNVVSMVSSSAAGTAGDAEARRRQQQQLSEEVRQRLETILTTASSRKEHIPPADGLCGEAAWFEVTSEAESGGLLDIFKQGFGRIPRSF